MKSRNPPILVLASDAMMDSIVLCSTQGAELALHVTAAAMWLPFPPGRGVTSNTAFVEKAAATDTCKSDRNQSKLWTVKILRPCTELEGWIRSGVDSW
jgi:hypothetical protein